MNAVPEMDQDNRAAAQEGMQKVMRYKTMRDMCKMNPMLDVFKIMAATPLGRDVDSSFSK